MRRRLPRPDPPAVDDGIAADGRRPAGAAAAARQSRGRRRRGRHAGGPAATTGSAATGAATAGSGRAATAHRPVRQDRDRPPPERARRRSAIERRAGHLDLADRPPADGPAAGQARVVGEPAVGDRRDRRRRRRAAARRHVGCRPVRARRGDARTVGLARGRGSAGPAVSVGPAASTAVRYHHPWLPGRARHARMNGSARARSRTTLAVAGGAVELGHEHQHAASPEPGGGQPWRPAWPRTCRASSTSIRSGTRDRNVIAFARFQNGGSQIKYVVPGIGRRPGRGGRPGDLGQGPDRGGRRRAGTRDHAPAWRGDGNLLFSRTQRLPTRPGLRRGHRAGDIRASGSATTSCPSRRPRTCSATDGARSGRSRSIRRTTTADPRHRPQHEVAGPGVRGLGRRHSVASRDAAARFRERATYAIVEPRTTVVAIERGNEDGWGPRSSPGARGPGRAPAACGRRHHVAVPDGSGSAVPTASSRRSRASPFGDGRYAVLAAARDADKSRTVPPIVILDGDGMAAGPLRSPAPAGVDLEHPHRPRLVRDHALDTRVPGPTAPPGTLTIDRWRAMRDRHEPDEATRRYPDVHRPVRAGRPAGGRRVERAVRTTGQPDGRRARWWSAGPRPHADGAHHPDAVEAGHDDRLPVPGWRRGQQAQGGGRRARLGGRRQHPLRVRRCRRRADPDQLQARGLVVVHGHRLPADPGRPSRR